MGNFTALAGSLSASGEGLERLRRRFLTELVREYPRAGGFFPAGTSAAPPSLVDALHWLLLSATVGPDGVAFPPAVSRRLHAFALDFRRFGFPAEAYTVFAAVTNRVLADEFARGAGATELADAARVVDTAASEMAREAAAADVAGIPSATAARIDSVSWRGSVAVVRLETGLPLGYRPGQCVPVMRVGRQGEWASLAPALPSNPFGQLEFHVDGEFTPEVGEYVTIGAARGPAVRFRAGERVLVVAAGTGAAAAKALVFGLLEQPDRPDVHVVLLRTADSDAGYDIEPLEAVARHHGWVRVTHAPLDAATAADLAGRRTVVVCGASESVRGISPTLRDAGAVAVVELAPDAPSRWD